MSANVIFVSTKCESGIYSLKMFVTLLYRLMMNRYFAMLLCFVLMSHLCEAQKQGHERIDSLNIELKRANEDTFKVNILLALCKSEFGLLQYGEAEIHADQAMALADKLGFEKGKAMIDYQKGQIYAQQGKYFEALDCYKRSNAIFERLGNERGVIWNSQAIGLTYLFLADFPKSLEYDLKALRLMEKTGDRRGTAGPLHNIGLVYGGLMNSSESLKYLLMARDINIEFGNKNWLCRNYEAIGNYYNGAGNYTEALKNYEEALRIAEEANDYFTVESVSFNMAVAYNSNGNYDIALEKFEVLLSAAQEKDDDYSIALAHINIADIKKRQGEPKQALSHLKQGLSSALKSRAMESIRLAYLRLAEVDSTLGDFKRAFEDHKMYKLYNDSIFNIEKDRKVTQQQMQYDFDSKEMASKAEQDLKDAAAMEELRKQKLLRNGFIGGFSLVAMFAGVFFSQRNSIKKGKKRSDELLLNILPEEIAEELKAKGNADAQLIDQVTVLFTDFKGFTAMSEQLSPKALVADLHECFSAFDRITERHRLEKIKTIGDAYMAAGGLPTPNATHASDAIRAAMEMRDFIEEGKRRKIEAGLPFFEIRIGIHTGPVVAGIVGVKKFQYDIWGDTVNTASRMESSGEVGQVNISETSYELVKQEFVCKPRGKVQAKGKGVMEMYFVEKGI